MRGTNPHFLEPHIYFSFPSGIGQKRAKSIMYASFESNTFARLCIDGQRGLPSRVQRLLRFNVVESNPLRRAIHEQVILRLRAKLSIAFHISACVIFPSPFNFSFEIPCSKEPKTKDLFLILIETQIKFN